LRESELNVNAAQRTREERRANLVVGDGDFVDDLASFDRSYMRVGRKTKVSMNLLDTERWRRTRDEPIEICVESRTGRHRSALEVSVKDEKEEETYTVTSGAHVGVELDVLSRVDRKAVVLRESK
jgi:hypothetical protein